GECLAPAGVGRQSRLAAGGAGLATLPALGRPAHVGRATARYAGEPARERWPGAGRGSPPVEEGEGALGRVLRGRVVAEHVATRAQDKGAMTPDQGLEGR